MTNQIDRRKTNKKKRGTNKKKTPNTKPMVKRGTKKKKTPKHTIRTKTFYASVKGQREQNEDCHVISDNGVNFYWGVYDGHGGKDVSAYVSNTLAPKLLMKKSINGYTNTHILQTHDYVQSTLSDNKNVECMHTGSTSLSMIITGDKLQIANVGDCRAVLCDGDGVAQVLRMDHKPEWGPEQKRIEGLGGVITRDQGFEVYRIKNLSVSRAFGDDRASKYVIHTPEIKKVKVKPSDRFVVLACDGLWDVMGSQDAVNFVIQKNTKSNIAMSLCNHAINSGSGDNVTAMVIYLNT
jgi:protein phosphatase 2C family protein 2/3